jgi:SagB-type dehydrogenase family enzyme
MNSMSITAAQYHQKTSYQRHKMTGHSLDWANQPSVHKAYSHSDPIHLPKDVQIPDGTLSALLSGRHPKKIPRDLDIRELSALFLLTYALTAKSRHPGGIFYFRNAASAGGLYPSEIYVATSGLRGLGSGLYHFSIADHGLFPLRSGNLPVSALESIPGCSPAMPVLVFFFTVIFFRSAWKYRDRSYRYHLLDTGHVVENLVLALKAFGLSPTVSYDFHDKTINHLLGLDETKEACLCVCHVPGLESSQGEVTEDLAPLPAGSHLASRVAAREIDYPIIEEIHTAGMEIVSPARPETDMIRELRPFVEKWIPIDAPPAWPELRNYSESVTRRRSRRNFMPALLSKNKACALLESLCVMDLEDALFPSHACRSVVSGFLTEQAEGFDPGFHLVDAASRATGRVASGRFMERMANVCLNQTWLSRAALHILFMADIRIVEDLWGPRGYRYAMITAGRTGERLYLAATSMGLGCCGIGAFYDGEAFELLGLKENLRLLYLVAVGPVKSLKGAQ